MEWMLMARAVCGAVLAKALPALGLGDLLVHSTQELDLSARVLAKVGLRAWENGGSLPLCRLCLNWEYFLHFYKKPHHPGVGREGRTEGDTGRRTAPRALVKRVV